MKHFWNSLLLILLVVSCNSEKETLIISDFIPENTSSVFKIYNADDLNSNLINNGFLTAFFKTKAYKNFQNNLATLDSLNLEDETLLCFKKDGNDSLQYLIISDVSQDSLSIDSSKISNYKHYKLSKDFLIISSSKTFLDASIQSSKLTKNKRIFINNNNSLNLYSEDNNALISSFFLNDSLKNNPFSNKALLDINISQDNLLLNGVTEPQDSSSILTIFKNTIPQENKLDRITPSNVDGFMSFTFDDISTITSNLNTEKDSIVNTTLFDFVSEVGVVYQGDNRAIVLRSIDITATLESLSEQQEIIENYRQVAIKKFNNPTLFSETFSTLINFKNASKYCVLEDFILFCNDVETLQNIIANYQNETTLNKRSYYQELKESLTDEASLLLVLDTEKLITNYEGLTNNDLNFSSKKYNKAALQFIREDGFAHTNIVIKKSETKVVENSITEQFNIKLDADLLNNPQFVTNHINKQKEIVVQDINNQLYLISNTGKILWKKQLQGAILGKISQIDMYKNGRLQLAFTTSNRVHVLDRNGKEVSPFPLKFNDAITQPLSVFDYDKKRNYRLLVTQGSSVLMYDTKGKTVSGFKFKDAGNTIIHQPQHFRIGRKDYLLVKTKNKLHILDRTGKTRVTPKKPYSYSNKAIYTYNNKFTTTSDNGVLISIDQSGNTTTEDLKLAKQHEIATTTRTLVTLSENKLNIRDKSVELDFGDYTAPKIFLLNDKLYITITDKQSQKVFVFDSQAKSIPNFPIYGNATIDFANADKDNALEFVTKGDNDTVILYQLN